MITKEDFVTVLHGHPRATDAIYWYCHAWHDGDDDLYKIMCSLNFTPCLWSNNPMIEDQLTGKLSANPNYDPVLVDLLSQLDKALTPLNQPPMRRVRLRDVKEDHILTARVPCILPNWPSRVYRDGGSLGVACSGGLYCIQPQLGSKIPFHRLTEDENGYVVGFFR